MNINLHIERLILDGLPLEQRQGPHLQAAVERELTRLLASGSIEVFNTGGTLASIRGSSIRVAEGAKPAGLGKQIAAVVYGGLGGRQ
ncbi:MAG: hypothetical protein OEP48_09105 [Betaproteobacteria bacterium]|nr:hypothetical protein [Betaproteobacteria bacterium]MDH3414450.1 hypothetical protein [Gammaproteobacteria bacterium]